MGWRQKVGIKGKREVNKKRHKRSMWEKRRQSKRRR